MIAWVTFSSANYRKVKDLDLYFPIKLGNLKVINRNGLEFEILCVYEIGHFLQSF